GPKTSIICSPMTSLKTSIKTITYLSDIGCLEIQGASLESSCNVYYDVPNGAVLNDENCMKLSPGSILMWLNIDKARRYCQDNNKKMIYSIGAFRPEWKYKLLWSVPCKVGKCLC
ncbi:hypothetical protein R0783_23665, partial [Escherichia coli]